LKKIARKFLVGLGLYLSLTMSVDAYHVALKNGQVIEFQKYRVTETALLYIDPAGNEIHLKLSDINMERTQQLNLSEKAPLDLPGFVQKPLPATPSSDNQPSLGDLARKAHKGTTNKRVFTNDDVATTSPDSSGPGSSSQGSDPDAWRDRVDDVKATMKSYEAMSPDRLAEAVLGNLDCNFPGRRAWQDQLITQRDSVVAALQKSSTEYEAYYQLRDTLKLASTSKSDETRLAQARKAATDAIAQVQYQESKFGTIIDDGKQQAMEWKRK
jgi:hypothetical protein